MFLVLSYVNKKKKRSLLQCADHDAIIYTSNEKMLLQKPVLFHILFSVAPLFSYAIAAYKNEIERRTEGVWRAWLSFGE